MPEDDGRVVEVTEGGATMSSTAAATKRPDIDQINIVAGAYQDDVMSTRDEGLIVAQNECEQEPCDDEEVAADVPIAHINSSIQGGNHCTDEVSSLQHTNMEDKYEDSRGQREAAVDEGEEDGEYCYDEASDPEHQKALQRRNMLIIVMLLLFLSLVLAIGAGVGLAVKGNRSDPNDASGANPSGANEATDDDEYGGLGGGVDEDDLFKSLTPSSFPSNEGPCIPVELSIIFDEYADETGWLVVRGNYFPENSEMNEIIWESKYYAKQEYANRAEVFHRCFPPGFYTFIFTDREADGLCCYHGEGLYALSSEGKVIAVGGPMDDEEETNVFELPYVEPNPVDADADGRDDRLGHIMPYDSSGMTEGVDCENFRLVVQTDEYGIETTWELFEVDNDRGRRLIAEGGPYSSEYTYVVDYCLASPKQYALYMYDWDRRGLCCETGEGWYGVSSGDVIIREKDGDFGEVDVTLFGLPADGSVTFSEDPTHSPSAFVPIGRKTAYPTESPVTSSPVTLALSGSLVPTATIPPTNIPTDSPTIPPTSRRYTPFPSLSPAKEQVANGKGKDTSEKGERGWPGTR